MLFRSAMALSLLVGLAIGAWHGFWIAYVRIPPFIVTLAGMLLWRGVAMIILNGLTISPFPADYLKYFTSFLPGEADSTVIYAVTLSVAFAACALYVVLQVLDRIKKIRKGYEAEPLIMMIVRLVLICGAVLLVFWFLAQHKGIPVVFSLGPVSQSLSLRHTRVRELFVSKIL